VAGLTLDDAAASVLADAPADGPVVVVAHSSGGLITPRVVDGLGGRVTRVVLTSASVPPDGGCGLDCMKASHRERTVAAVEWAEAEGVRLVTPIPEEPEALRESYGERLGDDDLAYVTDPARLAEDSFQLYFGPVHWSTVDVPVTYLRAELDRAVPVALQDEMIGHLRGEPTVVSWDCGHIPAVTRPDDFVALLEA
jgi:pimeloyl-ACP methyl ester carboxylesterase